jgi:hypothetical protein
MPEMKVAVENFERHVALLLQTTPRQDETVTVYHESFRVV